MKTFVIGYIHGAYKALLQCLKLSQFNKKEDRLICLGDVCDRGAEVKECIDELLAIPQCVYILGNHDTWALKWSIDGIALEEWLGQGGAQTVISYKETGMPKEHIRFLSEARPYFIDKNRLFVHGGFDPQLPVEVTPKETLIWDRKLLRTARETDLTAPEHKFGNFDAIYIGHTPTLNFDKTKPQKFCNVWTMDTGAGWDAKLTIMDIDTKQFWQSDITRKS